MTSIAELTGYSSTIVQLINENNEARGDPLELPLCTSAEQLQKLCNLEDENNSAEDETLDNVVPYDFYIDDKILPSDGNIVDLIKAIATDKHERIVDWKERTKTDASYDLEQTMKITCVPQALFRIRPVSRCSSTIPGHEEAICTIQFSPDGKQLASGSGDTTVRTWNLSAQAPAKTMKGHKNHVLCVAWSLDSKFLVSADKTGVIYIWNPKKGTVAKGPLREHRNWVTGMAFQPLHLQAPSRYFVTSSKDSMAKVWDAITGKVKFSLSGHTKSVQCCAWSGGNVIITGAQDRTVKLWSGDEGRLLKTLSEHAHWVNYVALSSEWVLRSGAFDPINQIVNHELLPTDDASLKNLAKNRWDRFMKTQNGQERLVTCSDDFTLILWNLSDKASKKSLTRMTGHQNVVMNVKFSPDARIIASCALDRSIRLWNGQTGAFMARMAGHVNSVYQIVWSPDSRLLLSGSADSTLKLWTMKTKSFHSDLPGHADEVYAIDWSPDGGVAASGGKDKLMKIWKR